MKKGFYNSIFLNAIFEHDGQYTINLSGFGYSPIPLQLDHNYVLNVLSQSSVCSYQNTAYDLSKYKHYKQSTSMLQLLPKAIMGKEYVHQIRLFSSNNKNFHLSKQDVKLIIFPKKLGLKVRPINESSYDTVELYGTPKAIGSIALVVDLYKIPDEIIQPLRYFIVPTFPDQSNCR